MPAALPGDNAPDARTLRRRLQGLLFFRLLLAVLFLILTLIAQIGREEGFLSVRLQPLYYFSCTLFLFTLLAALGLDRVRCLRRYAQWQLLFDVGAVTVLIYLSGGLESFFSFLYMPVIISSALLLDGRGSVLIASVCSLAYGLLMDLQYFGWVAPLQIIGGTVQLKDSSVYFHTILMNIAGFYLVAYLSGYLARELHKSSLQVREQKKDFHELEILHRNIVHSMGSGLLTTATDGSIVFSNHAARRILGLPSDRLEGQSFSRIFTELDPSSWLVKRPLSGTSPGDLDRREVLYKKPTGEELCLGYTVSVLQREEGDASGWVFIFQDLTQLKAMAEHVQRMERLAFAGRIASEIAHEIKNPLAAMSGAVQMLQSEAVADPLQSRLMNIVAREIDRIDSLVRDFLWLSRGAHQPESLENVSLCRIVEEMLSLMESREKITPVHRIQTFMEGNPVCLLDVHHVRQILWNLIVNALEAMPEGGELTLTVSSGGQGNGERAEARVDIRDTGCGIPPEIRDRVFEPFFTTKEKGTGLGLGIVYQLVERAGGRIEITHHELSGTTFSLFFPSNVSLPLAN
ncbi:nitrogen regulation protein NR(II) [Desulforhabdus sp. TSK]|uniref:two-component system sensor histidine kinase NtrB n=1 Tax=Desulforhabdus sp. TSK TaxID=2925014 RepID=UPI001FC7EE64|nr:ATP-binding protein [Desulforhabdus sp. TSK]GKT07849.1 PAS domain-containing sensor histidine kinase [Desulforhabdus sp. TSK]